MCVCVWMFFPSFFWCFGWSDALLLITWSIRAMKMLNHSLAKMNTKQNVEKSKMRFCWIFISFSIQMKGKKRQLTKSIGGKKFLSFTFYFWCIQFLFNSRNFVVSASSTDPVNMFLRHLIHLFINKILRTPRWVALCFQVVLKKIVVFQGQWRHFIKQKSKSAATIKNSFMHYLFLNCIDYFNSILGAIAKYI